MEAKKVIFSDELIKVDQKDLDNSREINPTANNDQITRNIDLLNFFISAYNNKYNDCGSMFDKLDPKDPTSTNDRMELFYEYIVEYQQLYEKNPNLCDCYDEVMFVANPDHDIYALVISDKRTIHCVSHTYISLLSYVYDELKGDHTKIIWNIVKL